MKKKLALILAMSMLLGMLAVGCSGDDKKNDEMKGSVAMVMPGLITDEAFNQ